METTATPAPTTHTLEVGDFIYNSWGYDQTNVDWYMVTRTTAKSVWIQEVATRVDTGHSTDTVYPTHNPLVRTVTTSYDYVTGDRTTEDRVASIDRKTPYFCPYNNTWSVKFRHGSGTVVKGCESGARATNPNFHR